MKKLQDFIKEEEFILHCGATGTELMKRGGDTPGAVSCITHPDMVLDIQREYVEVGAKILLSNTFGMNELYAKNHAQGYDWRDINGRGVALAKEAAAGKAYVLGNMGPTGELLEPAGSLTVSMARQNFQEQAQLLADAGVDGFSVQTFYDIYELKAAVEGIRSVSDLPIFASIVLEKHGATFMGHSLSQAYEELMPLGINVIGHNCGGIDFKSLGDIMAPCVKSFAIPLLACPNAGLPRTDKGIPLYDMTPEEFAAGISYLKSKGIKVLGGCCGADRHHIAAAAKLFD